MEPSPNWNTRPRAQKVNILTSWSTRPPRYTRVYD